jgi:hypothetical protein
MRKKHVIDSDVAPVSHKPISADHADQWKIEEHRPGGTITFDPDKILLYRSVKQRKHGANGIYGHSLRKELAGQPVLNSTVFEYLMAHPEIIPDSWKGKVIVFWGTLYRFRDYRPSHLTRGSLCVHCLYWCKNSGGYWEGSCTSLKRFYDSRDFAPILID